MSKPIKILVGLLVASVAVLSFTSEAAFAQDSNQSECGCCKKMEQMSGSMNR